MRILGDKSIIIEKTITCKYCGCSIGYIYSDIKTETYTDYTGGKDTTDYILCPKCSMKLIVRAWS